MKIRMLFDWYFLCLMKRRMLFDWYFLCLMKMRMLFDWYFLCLMKMRMLFLLLFQLEYFTKWEIITTPTNCFYRHSSQGSCLMKWKLKNCMWKQQKNIMVSVYYVAGLRKDKVEHSFRFLPWVWLISWLVDENVIWDKVFKNGASNICGRQPLKNLKWYDLSKQRSFELRSFI